jgi:5-methylcytosine-specific restriction endonuclease McrA
MPITTFRKDETGYFNWLEAHPEGYVVNTKVKISSDYMMLHRAKCTLMNEYLGMAKDGAFTDRQFKKTCSESASDLQEWAAIHGGRLWPCGLCKPDADDLRRSIRELNEQASAAIADSPAARQVRLASAPVLPGTAIVKTVVYLRNPDVVAEALLRAAGKCERCGKPAPFMRRNGTPYLEVHHLRPLSKGGEDTVANAQAQCPNCHRESHFGAEHDEG